MKVSYEENKLINTELNDSNSQVMQSQVPVLFYI